MGINLGALKSLLELKKSSSWDGKSVLQLGRQCIHFTYHEMQQTSQLLGVPLKANVPIQLSSFEDLRRKEYLDDISFFKLLGFGTVSSMDASDFENPTIVHDLNFPISKRYENQFDVIFDGGTLEHIFHFPQSLSNVHHMLKEEGVIIHSSPSHNHVDHGFYMFSPTLFYDYYHANHYDILQSRIFKYTSNVKKAWRIFNYQPGCLSHLCYGGFGKEMLGVWFVAKKGVKSTCTVIPQQGFYLKSWDESKNVSPKKTRTTSKLKRILKYMTLLFLYHYCRKCWKRRKKFTSNFVGKY